jgi:hypothetical protein
VFGFGTMRDFPSCFGENGVQVADSSSSSADKAVQNVVTYLYQCKLRGRSCLTNTERRREREREIGCPPCHANTALHGSASNLSPTYFSTSGG